VKKAIIAGSTGLVGSAVARHLAENGTDVLCLSRSDLPPSALTQLIIDMDDIESLPDRIASIDWDPGDSCVFYNFAWVGRERLTDGDLSDQIANVARSANAVVAAKRLGCTKFVNAGTMEETVAEEYLASGSRAPYQSSQTDYTTAKLAARDMCTLVAYLEKIDYVHTRLSVPLDDNLQRGGYACTVIRNILNGEPFTTPTSEQLFDITVMPEVAEAYHRVGTSGRNKADYFIGTGRPRTFAAYFALCERLRNAEADHEPQPADEPEDGRFSIRTLTDDTGFVPMIPFETFVRSRVSP